MIVQGTAKMLRMLGLRRRWLSHIGKREYPGGLFDWHANVIDLNGRDAIVLMNNLTLYPVVILKEEKFEKDLFPEYVLQALKSEGIHQNVLECFRRHTGVLMTDKTSDRAMVQRLRHICNEVRKGVNLLDDDTCVQTKVGRYAARKRVRYPDGSYAAPADRMFEMLNRMREEEEIETPLLDLEVLELCITLEIPKAEIMGRIRVPSNISMSQLHELILKLFDWNTQGEHAFFCDRKNVCESCELSEIDWTHGLCYEYGMSGYYRWKHDIRLVNRMEHQCTSQVTAMECRGIRPPWVLDGPDAYEAYQKSLTDYRNPGHEEAQKLHNRYGARRLSLREINVEFGWLMLR